MKKPSAFQCACMEEGRDGTYEHYGRGYRVTWVTHIPRKGNKHFVCCTNHVDNYKKCKWGNFEVHEAA